MLITLPQILDADQLRLVRDRLSGGRFVDGKHSAGQRAQSVKHNQEFEDDPTRINELNNVVMGGVDSPSGLSQRGFTL